MERIAGGTGNAIPGDCDLIGGCIDRRNTGGNAQYGVRRGRNGGDGNDVPEPLASSVSTANRFVMVMVDSVST